jgi:predicted nucleic acid-binding protein
MAEYFVDTWFVVATFDRFDSAHRSVLHLEPSLRQHALVTHDGVLTEFLAFVSAYGELYREAAVRLVRNAMRRWTVLPADRPLLLRALTMYGDRLDKAYSLVDCMSMVIMRERGITRVLTNDHHFEQDGFTVVNA